MVTILFIFILAMRKFVDSCIEDKLKIETLDSFKKFQSQKGQKI